MKIIEAMYDYLNNNILKTHLSASNCAVSFKEGIDNLKIYVMNNFFRSLIFIIAVVLMVVLYFFSVLYLYGCEEEFDEDNKKRVKKSLKLFKLSQILQLLGIVCDCGAGLHVFWGFFPHIVYHILYALGFIILLGSLLIMLTIAILNLYNMSEFSNNSEAQTVQPQDISYFEEDKYIGWKKQDAITDITAAGWKVNCKEVDSTFVRNGFVAGYDLNEGQLIVTLKISRDQNQPTNPKRKNNYSVDSNESDNSSLNDFDIGGSY